MVGEEIASEILEILFGTFNFEPEEEGTKQLFFWRGQGRRGLSGDERGQSPSEFTPLRLRLERLCMGEGGEELYRGEFKGGPSEWEEKRPK